MTRSATPIFAYGSSRSAMTWGDREREPEHARQVVDRANALEALEFALDRSDLLSRIRNHFRPPIVVRACR